MHTVFGDSFLLLKFLEKAGLLSIFHAVFSKKSDYERVLCHVLHGILKDGSKISCDNFIAKSFASYVLSDVPVNTLRCDTRFFSMMGKDETHKLIGAEVPAHIKIDEFRKDFLGLAV